MRRAGILVASIAVVLALAAAPLRAEDDALHIPLQPGLVLTSAIHIEGREDYEGTRVVRTVDDDRVVFDLHWVRPALEESGKLEKFSVTRIVRRKDLASATRMHAIFHTEDPEIFPGSTALQASAALLEGFKSGKETSFVFGMADGPFGMFGARKYYRGTLRSDDPTAQPFPVIVNGERVILPAIHVRGTLTVGNDGGESEFWWLDQPDNALVLRWRFKDTTVQLVRIDTGRAPGNAAIKDQLTSGNCRAELYGVYFDTGSAVVLPSSGAEITRVAEMLKSSPEWHVAIEGHTDGIGSEDVNLRLSQARADAVRQALVEGHGIAAERLTAAGMGETRPVDSNETLEGRAHNRRVELVRSCS